MRSQKAVAWLMLVGILPSCTGVPVAVGYNPGGYRIAYRAPYAPSPPVAQPGYYPARIAPQASPPGYVVPYNAGELTSRLDDFIAKDSATWVFNHYQPGSVRNVQLLPPSPVNPRAIVYADYSYNQGLRGWVKAQFADNKLVCVEFHDFNGQCRQLGQSPSIQLAAGMVVIAAGVALAASESTSSGSSGPSDWDRQQAYKERANRDYQEGLVSIKNIQTQVENQK